MVLLARREESYKDLVTEINSSGGQAFGVPTDVTSAASIHSAIQTINKELHSSAKLAVAVYNVAAGRSVKPFLELQLSDLDASLKGNAYAQAKPSLALPRLLIASSRGCVVKKKFFRVGKQAD